MLQREVGLLVLVSIHLLCVSAILVGFQKVVAQTNFKKGKAFDGAVAQTTGVTGPGQAHLLEGNRQQALGEFDRALKEYELAAVHEPDNPDIHWKMAFLHIRIGDDKNAVVVLRTLLEIQPVNSDYLYSFGAALSRLGQHDEAIDIFDRLIEISPANGFAFIGKAVSLYHKGRLDESIIELERAIHLNPGWSMYNLGCVYNAKGETQRSLYYFRKSRPYWDKILIEEAKKDPDLKNLQALPEFQEIIAGE
jgi:tetratricopeptide (TPR) repeat protein